MAAASLNLHDYFRKKLWCSSGGSNNFIGGWQERRVGNFLPICHPFSTQTSDMCGTRTLPWTGLCYQTINLAEEWKFICLQRMRTSHFICRLLHYSSESYSLWSYASHTHHESHGSTCSWCLRRNRSKRKLDTVPATWRALGRGCHRGHVQLDHHRISVEKRLSQVILDCTRIDRCISGGTYI